MQRGKTNRCEAACISGRCKRERSVIGDNRKLSGRLAVHRRNVQIVKILVDLKCRCVEILICNPEIQKLTLVGTLAIRM